MRQTNTTTVTKSDGTEAWSESKGENAPVGGDIEVAIDSQYRNKVAKPLHGFASYPRQFLSGVASVPVQAPPDPDNIFY
jgi:hypothetical protein